MSKYLIVITRKSFYKSGGEDNPEVFVKAHLLL